MSRIRVFIADDHELVRYALRTLLQGEADIEVVGESCDGEGVIEALEDRGADVLLLDLRMPGMGGVETCRRVKQLHPEIAVLVLTSFGDDEEVFGVLEAGAAGYVLKDARPGLVIQAVRATAEGEAVFDAKIAARVIAGKAGNTSEVDLELKGRFSQREIEVLRLMAEGMSNRQIARTLWISEATVKTHVSHVLHKMGATDRTQAVLVGLRSGLIQIPPTA